MNYELKRLNCNNIIDLIPIFKASFNVTHSKLSLFNRYNLPGWIGNYIGYISYDENGAPSSYYGVFPCIVKLNNKKLIVCQSGDTMTHPLHSGKGLFIKAAKKSYELAKIYGIQGVFGFPSIPSQKGFLKLGWKYHYNIVRVRLIVPTLPLIVFSKKSSWFGKLHKILFNLIINLIPKGNPFPSSLEFFGIDCIVHDKLFWNYKQLNNDIKIVKLFGIECALKFDNGRLSIGDVNFSEEVSSLRLYLVLLFLGFICATSVVDYFGTPNSPIIKKMQKYTFISESLPFGSLTFKDDIDLSSLQFTFIDFDTF